MTVCHFDIESFSECDLKSAGVYRYAEHPSTEVQVLGYRFDEGPVTLWIPEYVPIPVKEKLAEALKERIGFRDVRVLNQKAVPDDLRQHVESGGEGRAHNSQFERIVLNGTAGEKLDFPKISIEQMVCTMAKCSAHGLPRGLGDAAEALGTHPKSDAGRIEMLQLCKPRKPTKADPSTRWTLQNAADKFIALYLYNVDDVLAESDLDQAVPELSEYERKVYILDQVINGRGIRVDLKAVADVQALIREYKEYLAAECEKATKDPLTDEGLKPTQRDKLANWIRQHGYPHLFDMQAETVKAICAGTEAPEHVKHVLRIYSTYNAKAVTKYDAIQDCVCADGRVRGLFMYHGAGPGRWSSLIVQFQNLFRPVIDDPETAIDAFAARNLDYIRMLYPDVDPMKVFASCVRSVFIAAEGCDLMFPDYAGIESRAGAWLFDEDWKLEVFRKFDTVLRDEAGTVLLDKKGKPRRAGPDNYETAYARSFGCKIEDVDKKKRQIGKVQELFMQYEGGVGAFVTGADTYSIDLEELAVAVLPTLPDDVRAQAENMWTEMPQHRAGVSHDVFVACDSLKRLWRRAHPNIKQGWRDLKAAAEQAVQFPGKPFAIPNGKIAFKVVEYRGRSWLYMRLPSGRQIAYYKPRWIPEEQTVAKDEWGNEFLNVVPGELRYMGTDTHTRRWMEVGTYGGKLCENACQGFSACVLRVALFALEAADYPVIGSVHDEPVTEPRKDHGSMEDVVRLICAPIKWAPGLPLAIDGHRGPRYKK